MRSELDFPFSEAAGDVWIETRAVAINFSARTEFFRKFCDCENGSRVETVSLPYQCWIRRADPVANVD